MSEKYLGEEGTSRLIAKVKGYSQPLTSKLISLLFRVLGESNFINKGLSEMAVKI